MVQRDFKLNNPAYSLTDMLGSAYTRAVCEARAFTEKRRVEDLMEIANERVEFFPPSFAERLDNLAAYTGKQVVEPLGVTMKGAGTDAFRKAAQADRAPLSAAGFIRVGEDGRVYMISKSEHYHVPLGHDFPGYKLLDRARMLGIPNATHNNTRGYITRLLERELVRIANGVEKEDSASLERILVSKEPQVLNRVINLETGSLAVEAAMKMMLTRFYRLDRTYTSPEYEGKTPVFLVMADHRGGKEANYHGTTIHTQILRGMWPDLYALLEDHDIMRVVPVEINDLSDFTGKVKKYDSGKYKVAGFLHEIILMNYGGIRLTKEYLRECYGICRDHDIPVLADEIQSGLWSAGFFMFREYGLQPDFVAVGKGFPGGQFPASRLLTTATMDRLNLFGALVTNGQEELAALSYLITMAFAEANRAYIKNLGDYYEEEMRKLAAEYPDFIEKTEGRRHMTTLFFRSAEDAVFFTSELNKRGMDISVQTYKADCPPSALTKIPLIASRKMVDLMLQSMRDLLDSGLGHG